MVSPQEYLSFVDGSGFSVRQRVSAAIFPEFERLHLPDYFNQQALAYRMSNAVLSMFADSDGRRLRTP